MINIHSHAYNFLSFINAGVDPRTGTYSCTIAFSHILANTLSGPALPLSIGFNALNNENAGFGLGWTMPLSRYNRTTRQLSLSSGANHIANIAPGLFVIEDKKVRDIKTSRQGDDLIVEHKSGIVEVLSNPSAAWDEWLVSKIYSAEGRWLHLNYEVVAGRRLLREIRDQHQILFAIDIHDDRSSVSSFTLWPESPDDKLVFRLQIQNDELTKITLPLDNGTQASWRFTYETENGLRLISRLESPTGCIEQISYRASAMSLPSDAPVDALPAVAAHTIFPRAKQPSITREYSYSSNNYLGYGANAPWRDDRDNLYQATGNYEYHSIEELVLGSGQRKKTVRRTKRVYNRFHLQVEETVNQNGKTTSNRTQYHEKSGLSFDDQPSNFQLPARLDITYYDTAVPDVVRQETTLTDYDDFGNLVKKVSPTGATEVLEYYPPEGSDGCPADDFGGMRWLKQKTLLPAPDPTPAPDLTPVPDPTPAPDPAPAPDLTPVPDPAPAPVLINRYRYTDLPSASPERGRFLALTQESITQDEQLAPLMIITRQYEDDAKSPFLGRIKCKTETIGGIDTVFDYRYELLDDALCTHTTLSCMGDSSTQSTRQNRLTGTEIETVGNLGVTIKTTHDRLGRKTLEIVAPETSSQALISYSYWLADSLADPVQIQSIGANGAHTLTQLDGMGRTFAIQTQDMDTAKQPMCDVYNATYDGLGQLIEEIDTDWLNGIPHALSTQYQYDDWGLRCSSTGPDGVLHHDRYDPITLIRTQGIDGAGKTVTTKNLFGKDDSIERFDRDGNSDGTTRYLYDGLGRCVQTIDPAGHSTRFTYDFADRLVLTELADGTLISKAFVQHSTEDLATHIWVNDYLVGQRVYDGLLRVTSITVGGRTEHFTYKGSQPNPASHTTASGKVISYKYDPALNNQPITRNVDSDSNLSANWRYDSHHAGLLQASTPANQQQQTYFPSGKVQSQQMGEGTARFNAAHHYSLKGLALQYTDAAGVEQLMQYDAICRLVQVEQGLITAGYTYDAQGRVGQIDTIDAQSRKTLTTRIEYDDFGRENHRWLSVDGGTPEKLSQQFNANDQLTQRTLMRGEVVLREETYAYDSRGRLKHYQCSGEHLPVEACAKRILEQHYVFDELDNIRELKTLFIGGENIATFEYQHSDRTQLSRVSHSHPDYAALQAAFTYDLDGNQLNDEQGRTLIYDDLSRLISVAQETP